MRFPNGRSTAALLSLVLALAACGGGPSPSASGSTTPSVAPSGAASGSSDSTPNPTPAASAGGAVTTYTVLPGDTLFSIARAWDTTVAQLQAWNADRHPSLADDPDDLQAGWVLVVAGVPGATPGPTARPTARRRG